jgi:acyl carrier protein
VVAAGLELAPDTLRPDSLLCGEVCADSLDFYRLYVTLDQWCPGFELPSELELECTTLADTHHFLHQRLGQAPGRS